MTYKIAVYGTLKKGFYNHKLLKEATFVGTGMTVEKYLLTTVEGQAIKPRENGEMTFQRFEKKHLELTPFPYVFENKNQYPIEVEIYEITETQLATCDRLESVPYFYHRKTVDIVLKEKTLNAEMYFITV